MKLYKSLLFASAIIGGMMMTSCNDDGYWDEAGKKGLSLSGEGTTYSFATSSTKYTYGPYDDMTGEKLEIPVSRGTSKGADTLAIVATISSDNLLICPGTVVFEDGSTTGNFVIDLARDFEIGETSTAYLEIDTLVMGINHVDAPKDSLLENRVHEDTLTYKADSVKYVTYLKQLSQYKLVNTVTVAKDYSWTTLGKAYYREDFMTSLYDIDNLVYQVEIRENDQIPGYYRLVCPYGEAFEYNEKGDYDADNEYYLEIHAEDPAKVYISRSYSGMDWGSGEFFMWSFADYYMQRGKTLDEVYEAGYCGTLEDGIITFPTRSLILGRGTSLWYANNNGMFAVALPGYTIKDYAVEIAYAGLFTDTSDKQFVLADVTLGPDVDHAWVTVVEGKDNIQSAYSLIADGTITPVSEEDEDDGSRKYIVVTENGQVQVPMIENAPSGKYTLALFAFDANGELISDYVGYDYVTFNYTGSGEVPETWEAAYVGDYVYNLVFTNEDGSPYTDSGLTLYESSKGRYKITDWGYGVDLIFTMDDDGELTIEEQETGATYGSYGPIYISTGNEYWGEDYDPETDASYYSQGVFHFNVVYHVSAGYLKGWYGEETFTLTGRAESEAKSRITAPWNKNITVADKGNGFKKATKKKVHVNKSYGLPVQFQ